jgi:hypothetical protein
MSTMRDIIITGKALLGHSHNRDSRHNPGPNNLQNYCGAYQPLFVMELMKG